MPSSRNRSQSGSFHRSPAFGARKPFGVVSAPTTSAKGNFYVQLGAFRGNDAARAAWNRARANHGALSGRTPSTMAAGNGLIRVSVGGYARADADALCRSVKANGGACFVRAGAGDRVAAWGAGGRTQLAAR